MTEAEWLACEDPQEMLRFLISSPNERRFATAGRRRHLSSEPGPRDSATSDRKLRLFAVACCRRAWDRLTEERGRRGVESAERFADGLEGQHWLDIERSAVFASSPRNTPEWTADYAVFFAMERSAITAAKGAANCLASGAAIHSGTASRTVEKRIQCDILRDVMGNPFRTVWLDPRWLSPNDGLVEKLSLGIYAENAFDRLPILADALEDAGCGDAGILAHCRGPGPHVRGCWVVDLILGKE